MKFYDRTTEIEELRRIQQLAFNQHSRMTVITGRRRIGKTSLAQRAVGEEFPTVYLFVGRKAEASLCLEFVQIVNSVLRTHLPEEISSFRTLFGQLMDLATRMKFNLIIDEFQEFMKVNPSVYSDVQNLWDQYRLRSHVNLIMMGSIYSLMHEIFMDKEEPLFGRADNIIRLQGFGTETLKEIMHDHRPGYSNDELLALFTVTGGVPKYVELLCDNTDLSIAGMLDYIVRDNSLFTDEGKNLLIEELGKDYGIYFSILSAIASGINTQPAIEALLGGISIGGQLNRLIEDYSLIVRQRPIMAKERSHSVRYAITDNFLRFWFRYFDRYQSLVEIRNFPLLRQKVADDYSTFSGHVLEQWFRLKLMESHEFRAIGSWWERKAGKAANEIDIVALKADSNEAIVAEVKRQRRNYDHKEFMAKVARISTTLLPSYQVTPHLFTLEDM